MIATRIPPSALLLALAGLVPFLWASMLILGIGTTAQGDIPSVLLGDGKDILVRYGGIILGFTTGVLWGFAARASGRRATIGYALSVIPALWWFLMPGTGDTSAIVNLMAGFVGLLVLDYVYHRWEMAPAWWMSLRVPVTCVVVGCLGVGVYF